MNICPTGGVSALSVGLTGAAKGQSWWVRSLSSMLAALAIDDDRGQRAGPIWRVPVWAGTHPLIDLATQHFAPLGGRLGSGPATLEQPAFDRNRNDPDQGQKVAHHFKSDHLCALNRNRRNWNRRCGSDLRRDDLIRLKRTSSHVLMSCVDLMG